MRNEDSRVGRSLGGANSLSGSGPPARAPTVPSAQRRTGSPADQFQLLKAELHRRTADAVPMTQLSDSHIVFGSRGIGLEIRPHGFFRHQQLRREPVGLDFFNVDPLFAAPAPVKVSSLV